MFSNSNWLSIWIYSLFGIYLFADYNLFVFQFQWTANLNSLLIEICLFPNSNGLPIWIYSLIAICFPHWRGFKISFDGRPQNTHGSNFKLNSDQKKRRKKTRRKKSHWMMRTRRNILWILLNQPEIKFYLPFSDWFGTKRTFIWFQMKRKMVNTIGSCWKVLFLFLETVSIQFGYETEKDNSKYDDHMSFELEINENIFIWVLEINIYVNVECLLGTLKHQ